MYNNLMHKFTSNRYVSILLLLIISSIFLFLSYIPNLYEASVTDIMPKDRVMLWGEHIYTYDFNVYLSKIRQGTEGRWNIINKYDNRIDQPGVYLQMLYLLAGKIGGLFNLTPILIFHLLRTLLSFSWILVIIFINVYFLKKPVLYFLGTIFSLLASSFPVFYRLDGELWIGIFMGWWQELDVLKHISYLPHYTINYMIISILTFLLYLYDKTKNIRLFVIICVILFFSFFIHPITGLVFFFSWLLFNSIKIVLFGNFKLKTLFRFVLETLFLVVVISMPLAYIKYATSLSPWKSLIEFDQKYKFPFVLKDYILALGPVFITGLMGAVMVIFKKEKRLLPVVTWFLGAFLGFLLFIYFPYQSPARFVQTANHIPLAILSAYFIVELLKKFPNWLVKSLCYPAIAFIILLGIIQSYFSIKGQTHFIKQRAQAVLPLVPYPSQVMYPLKDFFFALKWLEKYSYRNTVVLSQITAGNYIPAYAGNYVYFGHFPESPNYEYKSSQVGLFFTGSMKEEDALNFLKNENIDYVFLGPQEKEMATADIKRYPFLKPVYDSYWVTIFWVIKQ